jgi:hypothetical protein
MDQKDSNCGCDLCRKEHREALPETTEVYPADTSLAAAAQQEPVRLIPRL